MITWWRKTVRVALLIFCAVKPAGRVDRSSRIRAESLLSTSKVTAAPKFWAAKLELM
jgi:hypothetical protein